MSFLLSLHKPSASRKAKQNLFLRFPPVSAALPPVYTSPCTHTIRQKYFVNTDIQSSLRAAAAEAMRSAANLFQRAAPHSKQWAGRRRRGGGKGEKKTEKTSGHFHRGSPDKCLHMLSWTGEGAHLSPPPGPPLPPPPPH